MKKLVKWSRKEMMDTLPEELKPKVELYTKRKQRFRGLIDGKVKLIIQLRELGYGYTAIAMMLRNDHSTIHALYQKYKNGYQTNYDNCGNRR